MPKIELNPKRVAEYKNLHADWLAKMARDASVHTDYAALAHVMGIRLEEAVSCYRTMEARAERLSDHLMERSEDMRKLCEELDATRNALFLAQHPLTEEKGATTMPKIELNPKRRANASRTEA